MIISIKFALNYDNFNLELEFMFVVVYDFMDCKSWMKLKLIIVIITLINW